MFEQIVIGLAVATVTLAGIYLLMVHLDNVVKVRAKDDEENIKRNKEAAESYGENIRLLYESQGKLARLKQRRERIQQMKKPNPVISTRPNPYNYRQRKVGG